MTPEELMKPRYKVIADYPGNTRPIGFVFTMDKKDSEGWYTTTGYLQDKYFTTYPHLFQPLQWWEGRKEEEMPEYLKSVSGPEVYQRASRIDGAQVAIVKFHNGKYGKGTAGPIGLLNLLPATEQEYLEYIKRKEG